MKAQKPQSADVIEHAFPDRHRRIDIERIHLLFRQSFWGILASGINGLLIVFLLRGLIDRSTLGIWLALVLILALARSALIYQYKRKAPPPDRIMRWRNYNVISLAASGLIWGSASIFLFPPQSIAHQFYLATVLCGLVAGAAMAFSPVMRAFVAFAVPSLLPLALRFLITPGELHTVMALLAMLYLLFSIMIAGNLRRTRIELLLLKDELMQRVAQRTEALEQTNRRLQSEIEERTQIEERLRDERDRLEVITSNIGVGICIISREFKVVWANQVLKKHFGELEGKRCYQICSAREGLCPGCGAQPILEGKVQQAVHEQEGRDSEGNLIWAQIIATPIRDRSGQVTATLEVVLPITQLKLAEQEKERLAAQLEQSRRFEAIATLAGGIAHQFNNALAVIVGNLELLRVSSQDAHGLTDRVTPIMASAHQMAQLTDQLLAYAKGGKYKTKWTDAAVFIRDALDIVKPILRPGIELTSEIKCGLAEIQIDLTQMQTVIAAVLSNAVEAIPEQGRIHVESRLDADYGGIEPQRHVTIRIADNGIGMERDTLARIFEPFFSTKFQGRGLAMAAVYGIIKNHGGRIVVESEPGRGTSVTLQLPARDALIVEAAAGGNFAK
jgi:PAS domain S-box-containing protein